VNLTFNFPGLIPVSTNQRLGINYKTKAVYKSTKYKSAQNIIAMECLNQISEIREFEADYNIKEDYIECEVIVTMPNLMAKKGWISAKSLDVDNCLKGLIDAIFKCFNKLDDKMICRLSVEKGVGAKFTSVKLTKRKMRGVKPILGLSTPQSYLSQESSDS